MAIFTEEMLNGKLHFFVQCECDLQIINFIYFPTHTFHFQFHLITRDQQSSAKLQKYKNKRSWTRPKNFDIRFDAFLTAYVKHSLMAKAFNLTKSSTPLRNLRGEILLKIQLSKAFLGGLKFIHFSPIFISYRNQSSDLHCKSYDWFVYGMQH